MFRLLVLLFSLCIPAQTRAASTNYAGRSQKLILPLILSFPAGAYAATSTIIFSGRSLSNTTQLELGVGLGSAFPGSNWLAWMRYMNPTTVRFFVNSINDWRKFITSRSSAPWGRSFTSKIVVTNQATFEAAVKEMRDATSSPGQPFVFDWMLQFEDVRWSQFVKSLSRENKTGLPQSMVCNGSPDENLASLRKEGYKVLALWHVSCKDLALTTTARSSPNYWKHVFELYRWFYLGGRYLAKQSVATIELFNEPNLQTPCLTAATWLEEVRVRSVALQDAYNDHATWSGQKLNLILISPPMSAPRFENGEDGLAFGRLAVQDVHTKFPSNIKDPKWYNSREYSYHQYNSPGFGLRSAFYKVNAGVRAMEPSFKTSITEHNIIAAATGEEYRGKDVMNDASFAAGLAGQVAALAGCNIKLTSVNKFSQTYLGSNPSGVVKNGLLWGDLANHRDRPGLCDYGGTSKTAEAYRLMLRRTPGGKKLLAYTQTPPQKGVSNFTTFTIQDTLAYYIYMVNAGPEKQSLTYEMAKLPNLKLKTKLPVVISAVSSNYHGEVSAIPRTLTNTSLSLQVSANSVLMATVPKGNFVEKALSCIADTYASAGDTDGPVNDVRADRAAPIVGPSDSPTLYVQTSKTSDHATTRAAIFKFNLGSIKRSKIISAVLELTQSTTSSPGSPQILTVLGTTDNWNEVFLAWPNTPGLLTVQPGTIVSAVNKNFINYKQAKLVGMITGGVKNQPVMSLDVGDYLRGGGKPSFLLTRMFRFDARGTGSARMPGDVLGGPVSINSREAATGKPVLRVFYQK